MLFRSVHAGAGEALEHEPISTLQIVVNPGVDEKRVENSVKLSGGPLPAQNNFRRHARHNRHELSAQSKEQWFSLNP